jgi:CelD/BcsL family acetyltransferase involved in cellulose biosynthesis
MIGEPESRPRLGIDHQGVPMHHVECLLHLVDSTQEFDALELEWNLLFEENGTSVFQSFEWQRTWWKYFGEGNPRARLYIIVIRSERRLLAIAPFLIETVNTLGLYTLRKISFLGRRDSDYLDILVAKGFESVSADVIASHLAKHSSMFDVLYLEDIPEHSRTHTVLYEALARVQFRGELFINEYCPRVHLLDSWEATLSSLTGTHRRHLNQRRRQMRENFVAEFEVTAEQKDVSQDMNDFIALHQRRWNKKGYKGVFSDQRMVLFHHEVARRCFQRGWLFLAFLRLDGKRTAAVYGFRFRDELEYYLGGVEEDGAARPYSPGSVLHSYAIEAAIKEGRNVYDFMRGRERYKYTFGAVDCANWTILILRSQSKAAGFKFRLEQLMERIGRRVEQERFLMNQVFKANSFVSLSLGKYVSERIWRNFVDVRERAKSSWKSFLGGQRQGPQA